MKPLGYLLAGVLLVILGGVAGFYFRDGKAKAWAESVARGLGLGVRSYEPNYGLHGKRAPLVRNEAIAIDCDRMVAFWDGQSRGTMHAVAIARRLGKPVEIITREGVIKNDNDSCTA